MLAFAKYEGSGNDFLFIDDRHCSFPLENQSLIQKLCHRQKGVGADGIILLQQSHIADFRMRIFNRDGVEAEMCGNGLRCLIRFIHALGHVLPLYHIETQHGVHRCFLNEDRVVVSMGVPQILLRDFEVSLKGGKKSLHVLDTGVPHAVLFVDDVAIIDVHAEGQKIRHDRLFAPKGVNVNFAAMCSEKEIRVRTYERGVEGETLACGTGAAAVGCMAIKLFNLKGPITIVPASLEQIIIHVSEKTQEISMEGPASFVFEGAVSI
jgi:diaminopimelate epimerase